ncbi:MAG TPA: hypothetical protein VM911_16500 [Pyrinomonadaceae bacterium]|jgi:hypothetical protein|nr:hypothetical protein [Pyrinomonadaceae bacterium]
MKAVYYRFTPGVFDQSQPQSVLLEVKVEGAPTSVTLELQSPNNVVVLKDDGTGGDKQAGDKIFSVKLQAADILKNFTPDDVNHNFVGDLLLKQGNDKDGPYHIFADILTPDIPPVQVKQISNTVQYTEHLVNIVDPNFFNNFLISAVTTKFYQSFEDSYDFINVIYEISHFKNREHFGTRNSVQGIGIQQFDNNGTYGSAGRLIGCTFFPIPSLFDGASRTYQHELGHQWVNSLNVPPLDYGIPHYPFSDLAACIMGWSKPGGQGLTFNFQLKPVGNNFELVADNNPKVYSDLSLYLMGFLPASQVKDHFVFKNQDHALAPGPVQASELTKVSINQIVQAMGARVPDASKAQKKFRIATIIVSRDGLLSEKMMRFYDHFSARAEETKIVPFSDGMVKGETKPFYLTTQQLGRLDTRIKRRILVDSSRDGGVWWFPQAGPFDPAAKHQGKALADHLRSLGHKVDELPRPTTITAKLLAGYDIVIRAAGVGNYSQAEITAYQDYVKQGGGLLLLAESGPPDKLALSFGLKFEGNTVGNNLLSNFTPHPVTQGVGQLTYKVGGGLTKAPAGAQVLGKLSGQSFLDLNNNGVKDAGEPAGPPVLGAMQHGQGRIVFCGDTNLWETVPQPLTKNVVKWLTDP